MTNQTADMETAGAAADEREAVTAPARAPRPAKHRAATGTSSQVRVTFTDFDEFMQELISDATVVEEGIVRAVARSWPETTQYVERELQLIAGYVVRGQVVELVASTGRFWSTSDSPDEAAAGQLAEWEETLRTTVEAGGLQLRGGRFGAL